MQLDSLNDIVGNSFRNFHARGLDYLCLKRSQAHTVKAYFLEGDASKLPEVVNPHDHRYAFKTTVLTGRMVDFRLEPGFRVGLRNYPRFPTDSMELLAHAEKIGREMAMMGKQGSFMIEEHGGATYWFTRRAGDGASAQEMAECDCSQQAVCSRTGCEARK